MQQPPMPEPQPNDEPKPTNALHSDVPHYEPQPESSYVQGYQPMPPQYYPPQQQYAPQQYYPHPQPGYPPQQYPPQQYYPPQPPYPMQPPSMYMQPPYPYQQQIPPQMMAPQMMPPQIVINNNMSQINTMRASRQQQVNIWVRILYFFFIGLPLGTMWAMIAVMFCCTFIGLGIGIMMFRALPVIFTLERK